MEIRVQSPQKDSVVGPSLALSRFSEKLTGKYEDEDIAKHLLATISLEAVEQLSQMGQLFIRSNRVGVHLSSHHDNPATLERAIRWLETIESQLRRGQESLPENAHAARIASAWREVAGMHALTYYGDEHLMESQAGGRRFQLQDVLNEKGCWRTTFRLRLAESDGALTSDDLATPPQFLQEFFSALEGKVAETRVVAKDVLSIYLRECLDEVQPLQAIVSPLATQFAHQGPYRG